MKDKRHFKSIRASMILMILVLVTSCIVAGTYAKYVSSKMVVENARVAKFGVTIEGGNEKAFSNSYVSDGLARASYTSVFSTDNVIAPGTEGTMDSITVSGKPEVSVRVEFKGEFAVANWEIVIDEKGTEKFYCPIIITVGDQEIDGASFHDKDSFAEAVNSAIASFSEDYCYNEKGEVKELKLSCPKISWKWIFDRNEEEYDIYDKYDTLLGNKACEKVDGEENTKAATIALIVTATVSQLD